LAAFSIRWRDRRVFRLNRNQSQQQLQSNEVREGGSTGLKPSDSLTQALPGLGCS
jgi:hypothetical protein